MPTQPTPKVSQALSQFETDPNRKGKKDAREGSQELRKFLRWSGDREVGRFTPHDMEQYAKEVGQSGADSAQQRLQPVKAFVEYWKAQGWTDKKLATHLRPPRSKTRGTARSSARPAPRPADDEPTYLSQEGYDRIVQQLEELKADRVTVTQEIRRAMADKDFRETRPWTRPRKGRDGSKRRYGNSSPPLPTPRFCPARPTAAKSRVPPWARASPSGTRTPERHWTIPWLMPGRRILACDEFRSNLPLARHCLTWEPVKKWPFPPRRER